MIVSNYTKLFSIEFLHESYGDQNDILNDVRIFPIPPCSQLMNGYRIFQKRDRNILHYFVQTKAAIGETEGTLNITTENKPLITFDEETVLNFKIQIKSQRFLDTSNLRRIVRDGKLYHFGNDGGNKHNVLFFLSKPIPAYNSANEYQVGMLVTDTFDHTFEALQESGPADPHNTTETGFWMDITDFVQYVNQEDLTPDSDQTGGFGSIGISFDKDLPDDFSLLKKSNDPEEDNTILGKEYIIHFKDNAIN